MNVVLHTEQPYISLCSGAGGLDIGVHDAMRTTRSVLIVPGRIAPGMFVLRQALEVREHIVRPVVVTVMDVEASGNGPVGILPHSSMQIPAITLGSSVVAVHAKGVLPPVEHAERQRLAGRTKVVLPSGEHLEHALPGYPEGLGYLGKAKTLLVKLVHRLSFGVIPRCCHAHIVGQGLTPVTLWGEA